MMFGDIFRAGFNSHRVGPTPGDNILRTVHRQIDWEHRASCYKFEISTHVLAKVGVFRSLSIVTRSSLSHQMNR